MDEVVVEVLASVSVVRQPRKARFVEIESQRVVGSAETVNASVELLPPKKKRVVDVPLSDVWLSLPLKKKETTKLRRCVAYLRIFWFPMEFRTPLFDLLEFRKEKYSFSLGFSNLLPYKESPVLLIDSLSLPLEFTGFMIQMGPSGDEEEG